MPADIHRSSRDLSSYSAYLVRLWKDGEPSVWRASAQSAQTGATVRFATLDDLFAFLAAQTTDSGSDDEYPAGN
jgi:hypothetical protein